MSTATKLEYLNDTKQLLKESINSLGGEITSQTTFRQYATELDSIYASLPKVSGTGSNIQLTPTRKGRITSQINGDTLQDGTPTPSTPVEIQSVTGLQKVGVVGKNLFDKDNANILDLYISSNGVLSANATAGENVTIYIPCKPDTTYTISKMVQEPISTNRFRLGTSENIPTRNTTLNDFKNNSNGTTKISETITTGSNANYLCVFIFNNTGTTTLDEMLSSIQIEYGSTVTEYEAFSGETYEINLGKNLFDKNNANILNALITNTGAINSNASTRTLYIPCNPNTTYTISKISSPRFVVGTTSNIPSAGSSTLAFSDFSTGTSGTITTGNNAKYLLVYYYNSSGTATEQEILDSIQIEVGDTVTSYSEYFTPIELNKIGDYKDYITGTPDNWSIVKAISEVTLNGTEYGWKNDSQNKLCGLEISDIKTIKSTQITTALCNHYTATDLTTSRTSKNYFSQNNVDVWFNNQDMDVNTFKTWVGNNNLKLVYVLATPTTEPITNTELISQLNAFYYAKSKQGQTNISVDGNLPIILDVSALKGEE